MKYLTITGPRAQEDAFREDIGLTVLVNTLLGFVLGAVGLLCFMSPVLRANGFVYLLGSLFLLMAAIVNGGFWGDNRWWNYTRVKRQLLRAVVLLALPAGTGLVGLILLLVYIVLGLFT